MTAAELLVAGGTVVTMAEDRRVVTDATIAVANGRIVALGADDDVRAHHPAQAEIDARGCVVIPGLVNAHQHSTVDPLIRSIIPDDLDSRQAIFDWAVPLHARVTGDDDELAATLTAVDCLTRGVTTVLDAGTVAHPERVAAAFLRTGIRGRVGGWGWDAPGVPHTLPAAEALARQEDIVRALPADGPVTGWVALVGHDLVSDELFTGAAELAERLGVGVTWHMSPGPGDAESYLRRTGERPLVHLRGLGVLGPRLLLGHAVWLDDAEVEAVLATRTAVASCPAAYLRLRQGYTRAGRHGELVRRGGRVALGCDSHNAADAPDVLRAAALLAGLENDRGTWPIRADEAFALATRRGAEAAGLGGTAGSLEVGKAADLVVLDARGPAWTPPGDLATHLVWGAPTHTVRDVVVDGKVVVRDREVTTVDVHALRHEAARLSAGLLRRAGLRIPHRWPVVAAVPSPPRPPSPPDRKDPRGGTP
ncbi:amidohydrolase family protein [Actinomadura sp. NPDC047616]|uniref:amidohydrolase family protein n=1 Tax=Actinomadura sp. NPDC047616 TaxID=3155914 RepID=UPI003411B922